ncbi:uncharacterized protein C8R40DRAFT_1114457 [Lentinula edodes]|uniref:uncharacterized protein n=1 Tax=Lentinula edodes TaxID=5353 RepID=UPI001E8D451F|nr:uncharacterized protein C8R40DRAFT_1114457 [Lentinula edodes]KAH7873234.1 hypothetical protein C8R40DRAFT_1114457 [Lentinula edodes]
MRCGICLVLFLPPHPYLGIYLLGFSRRQDSRLVFSRTMLWIFVERYFFGETMDCLRGKKKAIDLPQQHGTQQNSKSFSILGPKIV